MDRVIVSGTVLPQRVFTGANGQNYRYHDIAFETGVERYFLNDDQDPLPVGQRVNCLLYVHVELDDSTGKIKKRSLRIESVF